MDLRRLKRLCVNLFLLAAVLGLTPFNELVVRTFMSGGLAGSSFVSVTDAPLAGEYAYTTNDLAHIYVDFTKLQAAPHTTYNVLKHEFAHTRGARHGDGSAEMRYSITKDMFGNVVDDAFLI